jgi:hypothetical protein
MWNLAKASVCDLHIGTSAFVKAASEGEVIIIERRTGGRIAACSEEGNERGRAAQTGS